ncbi:MAG: hypothetical protein FWG66_00650, partial [Spirochaetes bacterium]|nr:hypothetical protein [Spirochaetota bacterium]
LPPPQANAVQAAAAQWAAVQEAATDQPYTAAEGAAAGQLTWRQAYAAFLREFASEFPGQSDPDFFGSFLLLNTNDTGIPTLIVFATDVGFGNFTRGAYAFSDGALSPIELGDMPGTVHGFYMPPGDTGIVAVGTLGGDISAATHYHWLELEGGGFRQRVSGMYQFRREDWDDRDSPWRRFFFIDEQEVSEDEFYSVFLRFSEWPDDRPRIRQITEENIQNVVLGGAWRQAYADLLRELAPELINWDNSPGYFFLYDINGTGIPNLIVFEDAGDWGRLHPRSAYVFAGGTLSPIGLGGMPGSLSGLFILPGDTGIVAVIGGGDCMEFDLLELEADGFRRRVSGILCTGGVYGIHRIDGQEVSRDEFHSVFQFRWDDLWAESFRHIWRMTEENIQNVVLGVDQPYTAAEVAAAAQLTWQQAYADLLRELAAVPDQWGMSPSRDFFLIDIDGTGTPNLIVTEHGVGGQQHFHSAYAFEDGVLSPIVLGDMPGLEVREFYMPPGDTGIVARFFMPELLAFDWLELENGILRRRVSGSSVWWGPERGTVYTIDGQEVSEDEFWSVFHRGNELPDGIQRGWRMTEENIQNVVLE